MFWKILHFPGPLIYPCIFYLTHLAESYMLNYHSSMWNIIDITWNLYSNSCKNVLFCFSFVGLGRKFLPLPFFTLPVSLDKTDWLWGSATPNMDTEWDLTPEGVWANDEMGREMGHHPEKFAEVTKGEACTRRKKSPQLGQRESDWTRNSLKESQPYAFKKGYL